MLAPSGILGLDAFTLRCSSREGEAPAELEGRVDFQARQEPVTPGTVTSQSYVKRCVYRLVLGLSSLRRWCPYRASFIHFESSFRVKLRSTEGELKSENCKVQI